jgi:hypothetical protein
VTVITDLELGGRIAQFGSGVISQVSNRILAQFVRRLNALIAVPGAAAAVPVGHRLAPAAGRDGASRERVVLAVTVLAGVALGLAIGRTAERLG